MEFASQLENAGLWEWAIFVLLHQVDEWERESAVKAVVARHACLVLPLHLGDAEEKVETTLDSMLLCPPAPLSKAEEFVVSQLGVPIRWFHEAKVSSIIF